MLEESPSMFQDPIVRGNVEGLADCHKDGVPPGGLGDVDEDEESLDRFWFASLNLRLFRFRARDS